MHDPGEHRAVGSGQPSPALEIEPGLWSFPPPTPERRQLLDVGGGSGVIAIELCRVCPGVTATVFDLPHVTGFAARMIAAAELSGRITVAAGGLFASGKCPATASGGQEPAGGVSMLG